MAMTRSTRLWPALATAVALVGCTFDAPPRARADDSCVIGGCAGELCADEPLVSPCIWRDAYVCYRDAVCTRQVDGACGWTPTDELTACLASHAARN
jgi:eight-cysteine-cluster-containing protein